MAAISKLAVFLCILQIAFGCETQRIDLLPYQLNIEADSVTFAVIGDYGQQGIHAENIANLVKSWNPDFIITTGDNNYGSGSDASFHENLGQYYCDFVYNPGAAAEYICTGRAALEKQNRFFPSIGNNDRYGSKGVQPYLDYFYLPGLEQYYDFKWGPVHFFAINSGPGGQASCCDSEQGTWFSDRSDSSTSPFKIAYFHHPPYSDASHGSSEAMRWNFPEKGFSAVVNGHDHVYARIIRNDFPEFPYLICGTGGYSSLYDCGVNPLDSDDFDVFCYRDNYGAIKASANSDQLIFQFYSLDDPSTTIDEVVVTR